MSLELDTRRVSQVPPDGAAPSDILKLQTQLKDWSGKRLSLEKDVSTAEGSNAMLLKYARNLVQTTAVTGDEKELQAAGLSATLHRYR